LNEAYWETRETLTIREAAILVCGGDPFNKNFIDKNELTISSVQFRMEKQVLNEKGKVDIFLKQKGYYGRELLDGMSLPDDAEWRSFEAGIIFFNSFFHNSVALLREEIFPVSEAEKYELLKGDIKVWLKAEKIKATFFLNDEINSILKTSKDDLDLANNSANKSTVSSDNDLDKLIDSHFPSRPKKRISTNYSETKEFLKEYYQKSNSLPNFSDYWDFLKKHPETTSDTIGIIKTINKTYNKESFRKTFSNWRK